MVIRAKIVPPCDCADVVARARLEELHTQVCRAHVTLLRAPAGYGKTTLLAHWHRILAARGQRVAWLTIDTHDRGAAHLVRYIAAALAAGIPELRTALERVLASPSPAADGTRVEALAELIGEAAQPLFLFLDDVSLLDAEALRALARLIEATPVTVGFVLGADRQPKLPLARLRARGLLLELGARELAFDLDESTRFMTASAAASLTADQLAALHKRSEGWIAGLRLASLSLPRGVSTEDLLASFSGTSRAVADFFAEDVFEALDAPLRAFLCDTSILEQLTPALCDAVTQRSDGRALLEQAEAAGLFVIKLDEHGAAYRYQTLFAEFLRRELEKFRPGAQAGLHRRASAWYGAAGCIPQALEHAVRAGDPQWLAELLETHCESMTYTGKIRVVAEYAAHLPEDVLARHPMILLTLAWLRTRNLRFVDTTRLLGTARRRIEAMTAEGAHSHEKLTRYRLLLLHREMTLAAAEDDMPRVEEQCKYLLNEFRDERSFISCTLYGQLIAARREQFELENLEDLEAMARSIMLCSGHRFAAVSLESIIGYTLFTAGKTQAALRALEKGMQEGVRAGGVGSGFAALPALPLSEVLYETNELERASSLVQTYLPAARDFGFVDQLISGYVIHPRLLVAAGDIDAAFVALEAGLEVVVESGLERLRLNLISEQLRLAIRTGQLDIAIEKGRSMGLPAHVDDIMPGPHSTTRDEIRALSWVRLAAGRKDTAHALAAARRWRSFCQQRGATRALIRWQLLVAELLAAEGQMQSAQRALREAIVSASRGGFIRTFVDEGPAVHAMLREAYESGPVIDSPVERFAREVIQAFGGASAEERVAAAKPTVAVPAMLSRLNRKEIEILSLVGSGMSNKEIGRRLGLTEGSVKWYLQQVYDKVGMRRRSQAVECARQFGLLN